MQCSVSYMCFYNQWRKIVLFRYHVLDNYIADKEAL